MDQIKNESFKTALMCIYRGHMGYTDRYTKYDRKFRTQTFHEVVKRLRRDILGPKSSSVIKCHTGTHELAATTLLLTRGLRATHNVVVPMDIVKLLVKDAARFPTRVQVTNPPHCHPRLCRVLKRVNLALTIGVIRKDIVIASTYQLSFDCDIVEIGCENWQLEPHPDNCDGGIITFIDIRNCESISNGCNVEISRYYNEHQIRIYGDEWSGKPEQIDIVKKMYGDLLPFRVRLRQTYDCGTYGSPRYY